MFAVISIPDFSLQAVLRHEPELLAEPVALLSDPTTKATVFQITPVARAAEIYAGMTSTQAQARCGNVIFKTRSLAQEASADEVLKRCALAVSPYVEATAPGTCTLDLRGSSHRGDEGFGRKVIDLLGQFHLHARVGVAATPGLSWLAVRHADPFLAVTDSAAFLEHLPVSSIDPSLEVAEILRKWGIHTLGAFIDLGKKEVAERLGPETLALFHRASPKTTRPLKLIQPPETFEEVFDFENPVESIEPLLFILRRFLDQICLRLDLIYLVVEAMRLRLFFSAFNVNAELSFAKPEKSSQSFIEKQECYEHLFRIPSPTCDVNVLFRMLHTHLETLRADAPVTGIALSAKACRPSYHQFNLFEASLRDPNHFFETLGRLGALLGVDRVGTPFVEPTHRPDAFRIHPIQFEENSTRSLKSMPDMPRMISGLVLRRFRPPVPVTVELDNGNPIFLNSAKCKGKVIFTQGPWKISGDWWDTRNWEREEWDIQMTGKKLYRLFSQNKAKEWFLDGVYD